MRRPFGVGLVTGQAATRENGELMKKLFGSAAMGALVLTMATASPAKATDAITVAKAVKLLIAGAYIANRSRFPTGTSVNTQYALTGKGHPVHPNGQTFKQHVYIKCNAHRTHCQTVKGHHGW